MSNNLLKKFFLFSYGSWIALVIGVFTTMITTRLFLPENFGKMSMFELALQVGMILTILGTDQSYVRFYYEEKKEKRGALLFNSLKIPFILSIILSVIILFLNKQITNFIFGEENFYLSLLIGLGIILQLFFRFGQLVIRMQQEGNKYSLINIFQRIFNLFFIILFFYFIGSSYEVLIISKLITLFLLVIISIYLGREHWSLKNINIKNLKHSQKDIINFGTPFIFTIFITWLFESFDKIALRQWATFEELGLYSAAMKLVVLILVLQHSFSTFWTPVAYEKFEKSPDDKNFFKQITILISLVMFIVAIGSISLKDIIVILLGTEYHEAAVIMPFLVFMPILYTISETTVIGINFYKKSKWHIFISFISCVANIIGNWLLVPKYGAVGASISTAIAYIIFFTLRTQISIKYYNISYPLFRIYAMIIIISIYAIYSIFIRNIIFNILIAIIPLFLLLIFFYKDLIVIYRNRKELLNN